MRSRDLSWDGCLNVRDLGGHVTESGAETRFGAVVRADSVRQLSDAGWEALVGYGIARIVDLRFRSELEADPPGEIGVELVHIPLVREERLQEFDDTARAQRGTIERTREFYGWALECFSPNFGHAIAAVADAPAGGVLVHCLAGKDRTGLVVALLLRLVGVARADVAADYAVSEVKLAPLLEGWVAAAETDEECAERRRMSASPAGLMLDVLGELEDSHGGVAGYLRTAGLTEGQLDRIRARLLG